MDVRVDRKITAQKAKEILEKNGLAVSLEQASQMLDLLYKLAIIVAEHYFNDEKR